LALRFVVFPEHLMSRLISLLLLSIAVLGSLSVQAQEDARAVEEVPSRWMWYFDVFESPRESVTFSDGSVVEVGDPRLGRWATRQARRLDNLSEHDSMLWISICHLYGIAESERPLQQLASRMARIRMRADEMRGSRTPAGVESDRAFMFAAFAFNATDDSRRDLQRLMRFESQIQQREGVLLQGVADLQARAYCAAALVMLDDDAGRDYLIEGYREMLVGIEESPVPRIECRAVMARMYDAELAERVEALLEDEAVQGRIAQNNISSLLTAMRVNGLSREELREIAATPVDGHHEQKRRLQAISALGMAGNLEDIDLLRNLEPDPRGNLRIYSGAAAHVIQMIECRHWQERLDD